VGLTWAEFFGAALGGGLALGLLADMWGGVIRGLIVWLWPFRK